MKVGDLVKYADRVGGLHEMIGLVTEVRYVNSTNRARILWSASRRPPFRWEWVEELKVINEGRRPS